MNTRTISSTGRRASTIFLNLFSNQRAGNDRTARAQLKPANDIMRLIRSTLAATLAVGLFAFTSSAAPLRVLFLGDNAGHRPTNRFALMQPALASRGIEMTYTDKLDSLNATNLARYDALLIYANHTR